MILKYFVMLIVSIGTQNYSLFTLNYLVTLFMPIHYIHKIIHINLLKFNLNHRYTLRFHKLTLRKNFNYVFIHFTSKH
jgi:hypothetical protein